MATAEKKIHFYKISNGIPESNGEASPVDISALLNQLFSIESNPDTNFIDWREDDKLGFWSQTQNFPLKVKRNSGVCFS